MKNHGKGDKVDQTMPEHQNIPFDEQISLNGLYNNNYFRPPIWLSTFRAKAYLKQILLQIQIQSHHQILEVGCDQGQLTELLRQFSPLVIGIDINPTSIKNSAKHYLRWMDAQHLDFPDNFFDLIISSNTIEHIPDVQKSFQEITRVLKIGGHMVLIYPWEPIRGWTVLPEAIVQYRDLKVCRQFHLHNFTPQKIDSLLINSSLVQRNWKVFFVPHPNFISVLKRY